MTEVVTIVVSSATGALGAYLGALWGSRQQARRTIDERIHDSRMRLYKDIWKKTGIMPRRPKTTTITYGRIAQLGVELQGWYYEEAGMYLSHESRPKYSDLQDAIEAVRQHNNEDKPLSDSDYELIRSAASDFRATLTKDLLSRNRPPTGKKWA